MIAENKEIILGVVISTIGVLILYFKSQYGEKRTVLPNGQVLVRPPRLPFLGAAWGLSTDNFIDVLEDHYRRYGDFVEMFFGPHKVILISDVEICKEIMNLRPKIFRRSHTFDYPAIALGYDHSVFFAHGNDWNVARRLTSPSFNKENVSNQVMNIWQIAQRWANDIKCLSATKPEMDFKLQSLEFTLRVITKVVFGIDRETDKDSYFNQPIFIQDFQQTLTFLMESILFRLPRVLWKLSPWHYGKYEAPAKEADQRFRQACSALIADHKKKLFGPNSSLSASTNTTLLSTLLKKAERDQISDDNVIANAKLFFLAGSETTSIGISFAMYHLATHHEARNKVRDEVDRFAILMQEYSEQNSSNKVVLPDLYETVFTQLPWTEAVFKECLRLQPPATFMGLTLENDTSSYTLSNGITFGCKDEVGVFFESILRCSDNNYEDAAQFRPERWLSKDPAIKEKVEFNFVAFGGGPRVCPGMKLAMIEGILGVAALVQHLDWTLACDPSEIKRALLISSTPNKMPLRITPRELCR